MYVQYRVVLLHHDPYPLPLLLVVMWWTWHCTTSFAAWNGPGSVPCCMRKSNFIFQSRVSLALIQDHKPKPWWPISMQAVVLIARFACNVDSGQETKNHHSFWLIVVRVPEPKVFLFSNHEFHEKFYSRPQTPTMWWSISKRGAVLINRIVCKLD